MFLWRDTHRPEPCRPLSGAALEVQVVTLDWNWLFIYPKQGLAAVNRLVIQAGQPVHLRLTSATVMQSFLDARLAGEIYAMAGMRPSLTSPPPRCGSSLGENVQFNGRGFQNQKFQVDAMSPAGFTQWLAQAQAQPSRLDAAAYQTLSRRSILPPPLIFGAVQFDPFGQILGQHGRTAAAPHAEH